MVSCPNNRFPLIMIATDLNGVLTAGDFSISDLLLPAGYASVSLVNSVCVARVAFIPVPLSAPLIACMLMNPGTWSGGLFKFKDSNRE